MKRLVVQHQTRKRQGHVCALSVSADVRSAFDAAADDVCEAPPGYVRDAITVARALCNATTTQDVIATAKRATRVFRDVPVEQYIGNEHPVLRECVRIVFSLLSSECFVPSAVRAALRTASIAIPLQARTRILSEHFNDTLEKIQTLVESTSAEERHAALQKGHVMLLHSIDVLLFPDPSSNTGEFARAVVDESDTVSQSSLVVLLLRLFTFLCRATTASVDTRESTTEEQSPIYIAENNWGQLVEHVGSVLLRFLACDIVVEVLRRIAVTAFALDDADQCTQDVLIQLLHSMLHVTQNDLVTLDTASLYALCACMLLHNCMPQQDLGSAIPWEEVAALVGSYVLGVAGQNGGAVESCAVAVAKVASESKAFSKVVLERMVQGGGTKSIIEGLHSSVWPALYRGVCVAFPTEVMLCSLPGSDLQHPETLLEMMLRLIQSRAAGSYGTPQRLLALTCLKCALDMVIRALGSGKGRNTVEVMSRSTESLVTHTLRPILSLLWRHSDLTHEAIERMTQDCLDRVLDIHRLLVDSYCANDRDRECLKTFAEDVTTQMLGLAWHCKGKYMTLTSMMERGMQARDLLRMRPTFVAEICNAFADAKIANRAMQLARRFFRSLRSEAEASIDIKDKRERERAVLEKCSPVWLDTLVRSLLDVAAFAKKGIVTFGLVLLLEVFPTAGDMIVSAVCADARKRGGQTKRHLFAIVSILKCLRKVGRESGTLFQSGGDDEEAHETIRIALRHNDRAIKLPAVELICHTKSSGQKPSPMEVELIEEFVRNNIKVDASSDRNDICGLVQRFMMRMKDGCRKDITKGRQKAERALKIGHEGAAEFKSSTDKLERELIGFVNHFTSMLVGSLAPGVAYERITMTLRLLEMVVFDVWCESSDDGPARYIEPSKLSITHCATTRSLIGTLWESYDRTRLGGFAFLKRFDPVLPAQLFHADSISSSSPFDRLFRFAMRAVNSPRVRICDIGALIIRLLANPHALGGQLRLTISACGSGDTRDARSDYLSMGWQLMEQLSAQIEWANRDLYSAATDAPMHGVALALRYIVNDVPFSSREWQEANRDSLDEWRRFLVEYIAALERVLRIGMVSVGDLAPEGFTPDTGEDTGEGSSPEEPFASGAHNATVCSWLCVKECSLGLGAVLQHAPLPTEDMVRNNVEPLISPEMARGVGQVMFDMLLSTQHRGALETAASAFDVVCDVLLRSKLPSLVSALAEWVGSLFERMRNPGASVTRRSAGIPFAFTSIMSAMHQLSGRLCSKKSNMTVRERSFSPASSAEGSMSCSFPSIVSSLLLMSHQPDKDEHGAVYTCVHAFNVMRAVVMHRTLGPVLPASTVSEFLEEVVLGLRSRHWAVRNAALMSFNVCVRRLLGVKRERDDHSRKNGSTFAQFFSKCPSLHPFLLKELCSGTEALLSKCTLQSERKLVQTSLYSIVVLLSMLFPAAVLVDPSKPQKLSAAPFAREVLRCTGHPDLKVRETTARALVPLVGRDEVRAHLERVLTAIPTSAALQRAEPVVFNEVHGNILQLRYLVLEHLVKCPEGELSLYMCEVMHYCASEMAERLWLFGTRCSPVAAVAIRAVHDVVEWTQSPKFAVLANMSGDAAEQAFNAIHVLAQNCIRVIQSAMASDAPRSGRSCNIDGSDVYQSQMRIEGTKLLLWMANNRPDDFVSNHKQTTVELVQALLADHCYEVRLCALSFLAQQLDAADDDVWGENKGFWVDVSRTLCDRVPLEDNVEALEALLSLVAALERCMSSTDVGTLLQHLPCVTKAITAVPVHLSALVAMGTVVGRRCFSAVLAGEEGAELAVWREWVRNVGELAKVTRTLEERAAAAKSLSSSGVLRRALGEAELGVIQADIVALWLVVLRLLEDDDVEIRCDVAAHVSHVFALSSQSATVPVKPSACQMNASTALRFALDHVASVHGGSSTFAQHVKEYLFQEPPSPALFPALDPALLEDARMFPKELDNFWEEPLLYCELLSMHTRGLIESSAFSFDCCSFSQLFVEAATALAAHIASAVEHYKQDLASMPCYDVPITLRIVRLCRGLYVLASPSMVSKITQAPECADALEQLRTSLAKLDRAAVFLLHPLVEHQIAKCCSAFLDRPLAVQSLPHLGDTVFGSCGGDFAAK